MCMQPKRPVLSNQLNSSLSTESNQCCGMHVPMGLFRPASQAGSLFSGAMLLTRTVFVAMQGNWLALLSTQVNF